MHARSIKNFKFFLKNYKKIFCRCKQTIKTYKEKTSKKLIKNFSAN